MRGAGLGLGLGSLLCIGLTGVLWGEWFVGVFVVFVFFSLLRRLFGLWSAERACLVYLVARVSVCCNMLFAVALSHFLLICSVLCCNLNSRSVICCLWCSIVIFRSSCEAFVKMSSHRCLSSCPM